MPSVSTMARVTTGIGVVVVVCSGRGPRGRADVTRMVARRHAAIVDVSGVPLVTCHHRPGLVLAVCGTQLHHLHRRRYTPGGYATSGNGESDEGHLAIVASLIRLVSNRQQPAGELAELPSATAAFLMGHDDAFITGTDLPIDGGVIAAIAAGGYQLHMGH